MYKGTTEAAHFLPRTGSHSTKGARNGRVDVLPPEAQDAELVYLDCLEQAKSLIAEQAVLEKESGKLNVMLQKTLPFHEYQGIQRRREAVGTRLAKIQVLLREAKEIGRAAGAESYAAAFMYVAKMRLSSESKRALFDETDALLGHQFCQDLKLTDGQKTLSPNRVTRTKAKELARKHRVANEKLLARMRDSKDFEPSHASPFKRPTIDAARVVELREFITQSRQISLTQQIEYIKAQLSRCESIRDHLRKTGRPVERNQNLWHALIINRAILEVLTTMKNMGSSSPSTVTGEPNVQN